MMTSFTSSFHLNVKFPFRLSNRVSCNTRIYAAVVNGCISDHVAKYVNMFVNFGQFCFTRKIFGSFGVRFQFPCHSRNHRFAGDDGALEFVFLTNS